MNWKKITLLSFLFFWIAGGGYAQDAHLLFTGNIPYNNLFNPAVQHDTAVIVFSPLATGDLGSSTFGLRETFSWGPEGKYKYWDIPYLMENSEEENFLNLQLDRSLLYLGRQFQKGWYTSFSIHQRSSYDFMIPKGFFELTRGNADYENETPRNINLDGLSINSLSYTAFSFGVNKQVSPVFRLGLHLKLLNGGSFTQTHNFEARIETRESFDETYIGADIRYQQSAPGINPDQEGYSFNAADFPQNMFWHSRFFRNLGAAADVGFVYTPDIKTTIQGAVFDVGFIDWNANQLDVRYQGEYSFSGFDLSPDEQGRVDVEASFESVMDRIQNTFEPELDDSSVLRTQLPSGILLGVRRSLGNRFSLFGLFRARDYDFHQDYRYTLGFIYQPSPHFDFCLSTSHKNGRAGNLGVALVYRKSWFDAFFSTENAEFLVSNSNSINLSVGLNLRLF